MTTFGGNADRRQTNKAVFDTDPKSMETVEWLFEHIKDETITYGGSLPKGQGVDALFYAQQLASVQLGRWILPNLKKLKFELRHRALSRPRTARPLRRSTSRSRPWASTPRPRIRTRRCGGPPGT